MMKLAIRTKLILSFWLIIAAKGLITLVAGLHIIGDGIVREAQTKVDGFKCSPGSLPA